MSARRPDRALGLGRDRKRGTFVGRSVLYAYDNYAPDEAHTCGQGCMATLLDFHGVVGWDLKRTYSPPAGMNGNDGKLHYVNGELLGQLYRRYPPGEFFGLPFTVRETIQRAMRDHRLSWDESWPGDVRYGGRTARAWAEEFIERTQLPVVCLIDSEMLQTGQGPSFGLHWSFLIGYTRDTVWWASWERVYQATWTDWLAAWQCPSLPGDENHFYALYVWK